MTSFNSYASQGLRSRQQIASYMTSTPTHTRNHAQMCILAQSVRSLVEKKEKNTSHPKPGACERQAIYRLTLVRVMALPSCFGSVLHKDEWREEEGDTIDTTLKVTQ